MVKLFDLLCFCVPWLFILNACLCMRNGTQKDPLMVCYFYGRANDTGAEVDPYLCTHIICADGVITPGGIQTRLPYEPDQYKMVASLKEKNPNLKVMVSLSHGFASVVHDLASDDVMERFALEAILYVEKMNFDGIDLDWEQPDAMHKGTYMRFIKILGTYLHSSNLMLSAALPFNPQQFETGYDVATLNQYMDFMTVMTYGMRGFIKDRDTVTAYSSSLYTAKGEDLYRSTADCISYLLYIGLSKDKILMGLPTYGTSYTLANPKIHDLHSPAVSGGAAAPYSSNIGNFIYPDVCLALQRGATAVTDTDNVGEYVYFNATWANFGGKYTIGKKIEWLKQRQLAGIGIWVYQSDDVNNICGHGPMPLLTWMHRCLYDD